LAASISGKSEHIAVSRVRQHAVLGAALDHFTSDFQHTDSGRLRYLM
jgi:hypothetical protein